MKEGEPLLRKDVAVESTWNKEAIYASWEAWEAAHARVQAALPELAAFEDRLGDGAEVLPAWFEAYGRQYDEILKLYGYVYMSVAVDGSDMAAKAHMGQLLSLGARLQAATAFAEPELTAMGGELLRLSDEEPALQIYRYYFEELLRMAPHRRSAEVEAVLGLLQDAFDNVLTTAHELTNTDLTFAEAVDGEGKRHKVHQATVPPAGIKSPDRERRRTAWESFYDGHLAMQNTLASNYLTQVKQTVAMAEIRNHDSVLEMMLAPSNLPVAVFHNVIDTFKENLPVWHRYWEVRRQVLGVDALHPYDIWAPLVADVPHVPYRQGVAWIAEALRPLGEPYAQLIRRACLEERWVDYAPNVEKQQGAAAIFVPQDVPAFLFTGYEGTPMCVSVLAHELGHSLHSFQMAKSQPAIYRDHSRVSMAVAETTSNFHQAMVRAHLHEVKKDERALRIALIDEMLFNFHRYFFIMPILAQFELEVYTRAEKNEPLTAPILDQIMAGLFAEGYGETMVDDPERTKITWAQFLHLYQPFYTFQYAGGIAAATALAEGVRGGGPEAAGRYLQFLQAGTSLPPLAAWQLAGVDMSTPEPVQEAFGTLAAQIEQLAALAS